MRLVFLLLAFLGVVGIAFGILDVIAGAAGPHGGPSPTRITAARAP